MIHKRRFNLSESPLLPLIFHPLAVIPNEVRNLLDISTITSFTGVYLSGISLTPEASNSNIHGHIHGKVINSVDNTGGVEYLLFVKSNSTPSGVDTPLSILPLM